MGSNSGKIMLYHSMKCLNSIFCKALRLNTDIKDKKFMQKLEKKEEKMTLLKQ